MRCTYHEEEGIHRYTISIYTHICDIGTSYYYSVHNNIYTDTYTNKFVTNLKYLIVSHAVKPGSRLYATCHVAYKSWARPNRDIMVSDYNSQSEYVQ